MPTTITTSYPAGSSCIVNVEPTDDEGSEATPTEASWSLYRGGEVVNEREDVEIAEGDLSISMDITLSGDDLVAGLLYFVFKYRYNSTLGTNLPGRDWARIPVVGVEGVDESTVQ